jgi:hypothetical protein
MKATHLENSLTYILLGGEKNINPTKYNYD